MSQYRFGLLLLSLAVFPVLVAGQAGQSPTGNPRYKLHGEKAPKKEGPERPVQ